MLGAEGVPESTRRVAAEARRLADAVAEDRARSDAALLDCRRRVARERALRSLSSEAAGAAFDAARAAGADRAERDALRAALAEAEVTAAALRRELDDALDQAARARDAGACSRASDPPRAPSPGSSLQWFHCGIASSPCSSR